MNVDLLSFLENNSIRFKSMRQLAEVLDRGMLKEAGITDVELIDELIDDMERIGLLEIAQTGPKLKVNLRFIAGPQKGKVLSIDPTKSMTVFGSCITRPGPEEIELMTGLPDSEVTYIRLDGERVCPNHMQIFFDPLCCSLLLKNVIIDCADSCGVYRRIGKTEEIKLNPDDAFRIGTLEFEV
jgi:hypothetical protein